MLFLDFFALPEGGANVPGSRRQSRTRLLFGTFESSIGMVRSLDEVTRTSLKEIREFTPPDRPSVIITTDANGEQWFMHWQIARYYLPTQDLWVLYNGGPNKRVEHIRRDLLLEMRNTSRPLIVPVLRECRILWLIEPQSAIYKQLAATQPLHGGKYVFYTDVDCRLATVYDRRFRDRARTLWFSAGSTKKPDGPVSIKWISTTFVSNTNPCVMRSTAPFETFSAVGGTFSAPPWQLSRMHSHVIAAHRMRSRLPPVPTHW